MTVHRTLPIREFAYRGVCPSLIRGRACNHDLQATRHSHPFATTRRNSFYFHTMITSTTHHSYTVAAKFVEERPKPHGGGGVGTPSPAISSWYPRIGFDPNTDKPSLPMCTTICFLPFPLSSSGSVDRLDSNACLLLFTLRQPNLSMSYAPRLFTFRPGNQFYHLHY
jgi:hypothetical protein